MVKHDFDVVIVGAGIVGATLAAALRGSGLELALVEQRPPPPPSPQWDARIYAFSPGSAALLDSVGVWSQLDAGRIAPVRAMDVRGDRGGHVLLDAYEAGVPQLAWIAESGRVQYGVWQVLRNQPDLTLFSGVQGRDLRWSSAGAQLELDNGEQLSARLVVAADGRASWVRAQAGIAAHRGDYHQSGVVANFACARAHEHIARQWFREDGILAWLPLPGQALSMVWSTDAAHTAELLALSPEGLAERVAEAGGRALGDLRVLTPAAAFPLSILRVDSLVAPGLALIGDAAHGVHPLSGQGVNLGLRDVARLARVLRERGDAGCGDLPVLRRYERARRGDILAMQTVTDTLYHLFGAKHPLLARLRNAGMDVVQHLAPIKSRLMQQALA